MSRAGVACVAGRCLPSPSAAAGDIRTPAAIRSKIEQVNAAMIAFTLDVTRSTATPVWRDAFTAFLQSWGTFVTENRDSVWSQLWGDTYTQAERFETRLREWQDDFMRKGYGSLSAPLVRPEQADRERSSSQWATAAKWAAIGVAAIAGAYVVAQLAGGGK